MISGLDNASCSVLWLPLTVVLNIALLQNGVTTLNVSVGAACATLGCSFVDLISGVFSKWLVHGFIVLHLAVFLQLQCYLAAPL